VLRQQIVATTMFENESPKTWIGLGLLGCAACACLVSGLSESGAYFNWANSAATLLTVGGVWMSSPSGPLNRSFGQIHRDIASGRQARFTRLQMICFLLAIALFAVQTYQWWHRL
jgi:hypothetical protein